MSLGGVVVRALLRRRLYFTELQRRTLRADYRTGGDATSSTPVVEAEGRERLLFPGDT